MSIKFSIVIPTYNRADLILETLETVFNQTYKNTEIIVVDNCSTDNTAELLTPLAEQGLLRYIVHDSNYERSRSRNTGMQYATGDFLTFLDSDDFMYPDCLKDAEQYIRDNSGIRFFHNLYELVNNKRERIYSYSFPPLNNPYLALASGNFISCIGGFIHREIYQVFRFNEDPKMIGSEDYEVWFQVLARYPIGRIDKVNSGIREHPARSVNLGAYENLEYQRAALIENIQKDGVLKEKFGPYLNRLKASFYLQQTIVAKQLGRRKRAAQLLVKAIREDISIISTLRFLKVLYNTIRS